ncbi:hypothetical protein [Robiginitalea sp. SC105]|uniref:hypothetical protein n=1 Tax=Robiginitalea sp. SC105 TaxID=2762332 RepID=UPI00163AD712|nr:hypothetical protein [Robiginitalea sp. SC105]MBC2839228.1 hypothetical protein [Robiginitalea sp. SC105]
MRLSNFDPRRLPILLILLLATACGNGVSTSDLQYLQGYWEIREVVFPDGNNKDYVVNPTIDYFNLDGTTGYRKKLQPNADGTFQTSDDALPLQVLERDGRFFLVFEGDEGSWEEEIEELRPGSLALRSPAGLLFEYARYEPLQIPGTDGP